MISSSEGRGGGGGEGVISAGGSEEGFDEQYQENDQDHEEEKDEDGDHGEGKNDEENDHEELSVLPRHTKVIVTGNNRTKSVLVGSHGVVKKAVGLGGWHWLVRKPRQDTLV